MPITVSVPAWRGPAYDAVHYINAALAPSDAPTGVSVEQLRFARQKLEQSLAYIEEMAQSGELGD